MLRKQRNVVAPLSKRREVHLNDVQTVIQVLTKLSLLHEFREVSIGRADHSNADVDRAIASQPLEAALLQNAQQLGLQAKTKVADFI